MRKTVIAILVVLIGVVGLAFLISPNPPPPDSDADPFTGRWLINGVDARGVEYSGSLVIAVEDGGYSLQWIVTGSIRSGTGRRDEGTLSAEWMADESIGPAGRGRAVYVLQPEGTLHGTLTEIGVDGVGTEDGSPAG